MRDGQTGARSGVGIALALVALLLSGLAFYRSGRTSRPPDVVEVPGLLAKIERTGELHAGYGVYPPYTQEDPNTKQVTGLSVELIEQIAKELKCKVVWHRLNWNTMSADLKRGEYDVIA